MTILKRISKVQDTIDIMVKKIDRRHKKTLDAWYVMYNLRKKLSSNPKLLEQFKNAEKLLKSAEKLLWESDNELRSLQKQKIDLKQLCNQIPAKKSRASVERNKVPWSSKKYKTPLNFANSCKGGRALIIAPGHSAKELLPYKDILKKKFSVIIGINGAIFSFEDILDYHIVLDRLQSWQIEQQGMFEGKINKNLPRVVNVACMHRFPQNLNLVKTRRRPVTKRFNIRTSEDGSLLTGAVNRQGFSVGTPLTQSIHFAGILGCNEIYLCGADLLFRDSKDYYYDGNLYRKNELNTKWRNRSLIVDIEHEGIKYTTNEYFIDSAEWINTVLLPVLCKPAGIKVYDFSHGLLDKNIQLDIKKFFISNNYGSWKRR